MPLQQPTKDFLKYLKRNPAIRDQIRAAPGKTLLYAGRFFKPMWKEIEELKRGNPQAWDKQTLPDVLVRILTPGSGFNNLLLYTQDVEGRVPWKPDGFVVWRALSGIFAANASGAVSFQIGSGVKADEKVFAVTEVSVLLRNPNIDATTRDLLEYYVRCVQSKNADINVGQMAG
ncbi:MAG: hypothetical protein LAP13_00895 [Acidobacteriia bacterium]|nr:hypothetical protein [Terriglobia bacterium]